MRFRLRFESLEARENPSSFTPDVPLPDPVPPPSGPTTPPPQSDPSTPPPTNPDPNGPTIPPSN